MSIDDNIIELRLRPSGWRQLRKTLQYYPGVDLNNLGVVFCDALATLSRRHGSSSWEMGINAVLLEFACGMSRIPYAMRVADNLSYLTDLRSARTTLATYFPDEIWEEKYGARDREEVRQPPLKKGGGFDWRLRVEQRPREAVVPPCFDYIHLQIGTRLHDAFVDLRASLSKVALRPLLEDLTDEVLLTAVFEIGVSLNRPRSSNAAMDFLRSCQLMRLYVDDIERLIYDQQKRMDVAGQAALEALTYFCIWGATVNPLAAVKADKGGTPVITPVRKKRTRKSRKENPENLGPKFRKLF